MSMWHLRPGDDFGSGHAQHGGAILEKGRLEDLGAGLGSSKKCVCLKTPESNDSVNMLLPLFWL